MRRTLLGLTALLVICGALLIETTEAGRRRKSRCCTPGPTCCAATAGSVTCLQTTMFSFDGSTCMYVANYYADSSTFANPMATSWDGPCNQTVPMNCPNCNPRFAHGSWSRGPHHFAPLNHKIQFLNDIDEKNHHLGPDPHLSIISRGFVTFSPTKQNSAGQTSNNAVIARLLVIQLDDPHSPAPTVFALGYEVDPTDSNLPANIPTVPFDDSLPTDPCRIVHDGLDYNVRLCLEVP